jgi:hypothetical protein
LDKGAVKLEESNEKKLESNEGKVGSNEKKVESNERKQESSSVAVMESPIKIRTMRNPFARFYQDSNSKAIF